jgi:hypothetical protein
VKSWGSFSDALDGFSLVLDGTNGLFFTRRFSFQKNGLEDVVLFLLRPNHFATLVCAIRWGNT